MSLAPMVSHCSPLDYHRGGYLTVATLKRYFLTLFKWRMNLYDTKIKIFPDGTRQYRANIINTFYNNYRFTESLSGPNPDPIRSLKNSYKRTIEHVYDLVHSNEWDYFFTLTLDPKKVDRYDYSDSCTAIHRFTQLLYLRDIRYVIVPEKHKDGAWHFHGLSSYVDSRYLSINNNGFLEFNFYNYGFTSMDPVRDSARAGNYILKYMVKGYNYVDIPKGKKRYWASRSLNVPEVEYDVLTQDQIDELINNSFYKKDICSDFYNGYIIDVKEY